MIDYNKQNKLIQLKYSFIEFFNKYKIKIIILGIILLIALLTGIFTSVKLLKLDDDLDLENFDMKIIMSGDIGSFKYFLLRLLSFVVVALLLFLFSFNKGLSILGFLLLGYRTYLLALNCTVIILKLGISGVFTSLIIVLPCHLINIILLSLMFFCFVDLNYDKRKCGYYDKNLLKLLLYIGLALLLASFIEMLLVLIFSPKTLFII